ncbi:MAG: FAD-dependent oxidoreductase [Cytophagales bacterium]|nr:FAD-dependent oxidoreductase [Cytophagales bacterium]
MKPTITVIGAGISGLAAARFLAETAEVEVLEKAGAVGGLVQCDYVRDNLFHKVGGHVFNAKNKEISDWFWAQFDVEAEFYRVRRNAKILLNGKLVGYPLENYLYQLDKETVTRVMDDLLALRARAAGEPAQYDNFRDFLEGNFGKTLYRLYFEPYNRKIWNTDLSRIPLEWLHGKLPMPNLREILLSNVLREEESAMVHATFYYPKAGGSQFIADRLAEGLRVRREQAVRHVQPRDGRLVVDGTREADAVVYTGDVRKLPDLLHTGDAGLREALEGVRNLRSEGTSNLFCECDANDVSWLYLPEPSVRAHRIIYTGNFSAANNRGSARRTCVVEFAGCVDRDVMEAEIRKLPGNLVPLAANYEPNSYVIQEKDTRRAINALKERLQKYNFHLLGRFAEWEYYNMDKAIEAARNLAGRLAPEGGKPGH